MNCAIGSPGLGFYTNTLGAYHVVDHGAQRASSNIVVLLQVPDLVSDGHSALLGLQVGAGLIPAKLAGSVWPCRLIVGQHLASLRPFKCRLRTEDTDEAVY